MIDSLHGLLWSLAYKHIFRINCLSSLLSSGNFLEARRPLNSTANLKIDDSYKKQLTDLFEVVRNVTRQDHLRNDLAHIPVLRFWKQFKNVVLGVEQQLERDCAVMVLEDAAVVVAQGLGVLHRNQERIVDTPKQELANLNLKATYGCATSQQRQAKKPAIIFRSEKWFINSPVFVK